MTEKQKIVEYKLLSSMDDFHGLTAQVNIYLKEGWSLHGITMIAVQHYSTSSSSIFHSQAMVKEEHDA